MLLNKYSTKAYNLRNRAGTGIATQVDRDLNDTPSLIDADNLSNEVAPRDAGPVSDSGPTIAVRLYSDAVASRPPSPRRERPVQSSESPERDPDSIRAPDRSYDGSYVNNSSNDKDVEGNDPNKEIETPDRVEYSNWTTVKRRRARSEGSLPDKRPLTSEQTQAVLKAVGGLTHEQKQKILRRQEKVRPRRDSSISSRGEGPSKPKGKTIDPREWGNLNISRESLDLEAQAAAWESYKNQPKITDKYAKEKHGPRKEKARPSKKQKGPSKHSSKRHETAKRPLESQPAAQIAPKSYLGTALKTVGCSKGSRYPSDPSSSSSSDSSSESPGASSSDSEDDSQSKGSTDESYESGRSN
jgi:hypothetical protein